MSIDPSPTLTRDASGPVLLATLLAEQGRLATPAARFAHAHDASPGLAGVYRDLIPLAAPAPGEQYAFEVDLDACTGCKACVAACHSLNGLDEDETWRDVGLVLGSADGRPYQQTITSACHHCADPGCLNGCPVAAYEKDPTSGIVRHLDDQCIGCQYCILTCPYDVPKYNDRLGIVRKCDLCHGRLAHGEAPACVQACPTSAIRVVTVALGPDRRGDTTGFLSAAPSPSHTRPTTRYVSARPIPDDARPADAEATVVQHGHAPLAFMLVGTQLSLGALLADARIPALVLASGGLLASIGHLGRPERAWRAFLGLRTSWLSREILLFGAYLPLLAATVLFSSTLLGVLAAAVGAAGVLSSVMIYAVTPRLYWRLPWTLARFGATVLVGALEAEALHRPLAFALLAFGSVSLARLTLELAQAARVPASRRALNGPLRAEHVARHALPVLALAVWILGFPWPALVLLGLGELFERTLYFKAVDPSKMPGLARLSESERRHGVAESNSSAEAIG
ncbi:anaerobic dimethyl sulfoxide reductase chain B [mine drainage metagenome]|uniref:Anaerobic dimethyl sulfoxide reductase chain B n=1 Tax=mine drainage metagenome TaxID=410659 RepID=A0A1J5S8E2_9ZZZZ